MSQLTTKIRDKLVQLSLPWKAPADEIVGRDREMRAVLAAWMGGPGHFPLTPLLVGIAGQGKNRIIYECTKMCNKELYMVQGHEDVGAEDLICVARKSDDPDKMIDYQASPLVTAMLRGGVCFIDEIGKIRRRALAPLSSLLDERRYIDSVQLGERFIASPGFRFIAATNDDDFDDNPLPEFVASRMRPAITVDYLEPDEINRIIRARCQEMIHDSAELLDRFWELWRETKVDPPTPRDATKIFEFAVNLKDLEAIRDCSPYDLENRSGACAVQICHLEEAFQQFLTTGGKNGNGRSAHSSQIRK
jgi:MoxR-like ATPase